MLLWVFLGALASCELADRQLPSDPDWRGSCAFGVGLDAVLHGSPTDPRITWATDRSVNARIELLWPIGYSARFNPSLELLDEQGRVVGREGNYIISSCVPDPDDDGAIRVSAEDISAEPR
jgi:hypothetical protein